MRLYRKIPHGSMTSDDWQTWPASTSASSSPQATMGADSARFGGVPSSAHPAGHAHFRGGPPSGSSGGTVEEEDVKSAEEGLSSSARSEESETRMGARSVGAGFAHAHWEVGKIVFIVVFLGLAGLSNWAVLAYTHDFVGREPLPDIVFKLVPEITIAAKFGDILVSVCLACLFLLLLFHQCRFTILRRVFFIAATLYSMRSVTLLATQLPPGYSDNAKRCRQRASNFSFDQFMGRWGEQTVRFGFQFQKKDSQTLGEDGMLCGDMLFSGHTLVMMVCLLTVTHYLPAKWRLLRVLPYCFAYAGMTCMIVSRTHYTIDVVIAHWLTTLIFASYHAYAESDLFMDRRQSVLHDYAYFRLVAWLEENIVPGKLENVFVNPIEQLRAHFDDGGERRDVGTGHHKQVSVSSSSTFAMPSTA